MSIFIGADPGVSGALALYDSEDSYLLAVVDMPTVVRNGKRRIDLTELARILSHWSDDHECHGVIEHVHAMPGQGVTSSFSFGFSAGSLQQAFSSARIPFKLVQPAVWKAIYGLRGGKENKDMSRAKATELFPFDQNYWQRKKDDGRAEAALLAHYGSKLQWE